MIVRLFTQALINSLNGIKATWKQEKAFRLEIIGIICLLPLIFLANTPYTNKFFVIFSLGLVLVTELLNTAIEKANDALKIAKDPLIKHSKDAASASVLIALCLVGISLVNLVLN